MRFAVSALAIGLLCATPALADEQDTVILPTNLIATLASYLSRQPYGDVAQIINALSDCIALQKPNSQGAIVSRGGQCPAVQAALQADASKDGKMPKAPEKMHAPDPHAMPPSAPAPRPTPGK